MKIIREPHEMQQTALTLRDKAIRIGLVPTMGAFHDGHVSLMRRAKQENDVCVVSLFVNPLQFNDPSDFERYPRDEAADLEIARTVGVDILFMPSAAAMYPPDAQTFVEVTRVSQPLCGRHRPGHFRGVATVVAKLLMITLPRRVYFGLKDYQQCRVVAQMARDLYFPPDLVFCPTVREADGLAMSSRNARLSPEERRASVVLPRSLELAQELFAAGERNPAVIRERVRGQLVTEPLAEVEYVEVVDAQTLEPVTEIVQPALVAIAAHFGRTRLIDSVVLTPPRPEPEPSAPDPLDISDVPGRAR
ncbi:pantoate--beta-alanine ligase [Chloracidobacterium thermophilum]|uniref:pantoate--beta-alanine ligase n=1 Tax=Chloracidobacterium thermophilum TaxID=458033 RepID=UPI0007386F4E|nr:pantoate--beta-alanine ligase [Chloracidobacterium thermophilum]